MPDLQTFSTLHPEFQEPLFDPLAQNITAGLQGGLRQFPGFDQVGPVFDAGATQQYFQSAFVDPTVRGLTGPYGAIPRIGARSAQRGTFFSSGRQQLEAEAVGGAFGNLSNVYAGLVGQDQSATYQDWLRRQPTGQIARQALNFLGTPMTVTSEDDDVNPWMGAASGAVSGAAAGSIFGPWGAGIGAAVGGGIGFFGS